MNASICISDYGPLTVRVFDGKIILSLGDPAVQIPHCVSLDIADAETLATEITQCVARYRAGV